MRELNFRLAVGDLLEFGFPYPGELAWGYRNGWLDDITLVAVAEELASRNIPLCPQEEAVALLLRNDLERVGGFVQDMGAFEDDSSSRVWCYYIARHIEESVIDAKVRFELLDVAWADLGYPDELRDVLFPEEFHPAHVYVDLGQRALIQFLDRWRATLLARDPMGRLGAR